MDALFVPDQAAAPFLRANWYKIILGRMLAESQSRMVQIQLGAQNIDVAHFSEALKKDFLSVLAVTAAAHLNDPTQSHAYLVHNRRAATMVQFSHTMIPAAAFVFSTTGNAQTNPLVAPLLTLLNSSYAAYEAVLPVLDQLITMMLPDQYCTAVIINAFTTVQNSRVQFSQHHEALALCIVSAFFCRYCYSKGKEGGTVRQGALGGKATQDVAFDRQGSVNPMGGILPKPAWDALKVAFGEDYTLASLMPNASSAMMLQSVLAMLQGERERDQSKTFISVEYHSYAPFGSWFSTLTTYFPMLPGRGVLAVIKQATTHFSELFLIPPLRAEKPRVNEYIQKLSRAGYLGQWGYLVGEKMDLPTAEQFKVLGAVILRIGGNDGSSITGLINTSFTDARDQSSVVDIAATFEAMRSDPEYQKAVSSQNVAEVSGAVARLFGEAKDARIRRSTGGPQGAAAPRAGATYTYPTPAGAFDIGGVGGGPGAF